MNAKTCIRALSAAFLILAVAACTPKQALLFEGTGSHTRTVTTRDPLAQQYFDQGLALSYGFNHDEAVNSFKEAARIDPDCAMAYWGLAYAAGPNINWWKPFPEQEAAAYEAIQTALKLSGHATPVERDLIQALSVRFDGSAPEDRTQLNRAYADAMAEVWKNYPEDADVGFLYADALMNLNPWDQWTPAPDFEPKENTLEIVATLERVMQLDINHPGANHFYIHVIEASADPGKAEAAADRLGSLTPGLGHMVHMPSHIYVQVGRFEDSIRVNEDASRLDREYFAKAGDQMGYHFYHAHNNHFRVWSGLYTGNYDDALEAARLTLEDLPDAFESSPDAAQWLTMELEVYLRFGEWQEVLNLPKPLEDQHYAVAMWHYGRGIAFANTERISQARVEAELFEQEVARIPQDQMVFIVSALDVMDVAREMLAGEIEYKAGNIELGFEHLRKSIVAEDALRYSEPSPWMVPTRHSLGALLLEQGGEEHIKEAEQLYREDLMESPENIWSMAGLMECLQRQGKDDEARALSARFDRAKAFASVTVQSSCPCRTQNWIQPGEPL